MTRVKVGRGLEGDDPEGANEMSTKRGRNRYIGIGKQEARDKSEEEEELREF